MPKYTKEEKKKLSESGKKGADKRWNPLKATRKELIDKASGQVDKEILNLIQSKLSNEEIIRLLRAWGIK